MEKSPTQLMLEAQRQQPIKEILKTALECRRGYRNLVTTVSVDLGISYGTLYRWCGDMDIKIDDYRRPTVPPVEE